MKGRRPSADEQRHMDAVRELGCICCWGEGYSSPAEIHHIDGKTKPGAHFRVLPLCHLHHRAGVDNEHATSRHPHKKRFEKRYKTEAKLLKLVTAMLAREL